MTSRGGPYHSYKAKTACSLYSRKPRPGSKSWKELNQATPNAHLKAMREDYKKMTAKLIWEHGENCFARFNIDVGNT